MINLAIVGLGARGAGVYGAWIDAHRDIVSISAVCDTDASKLEIAAKRWNIKLQNCFTDFELMAKANRLADGMLICTQDSSHYEQAMLALDSGYHLLLEKPIATSLAECQAIASKSIQNNLQVVVAHVLRYNAHFNCIKQMIESRQIGDVLGIEHTENVGYWHFAHSFVRGPWRNSSESNPIILSKCCHDLDIINYLANSQCTQLSSVGSLKYFNPTYQPQGASNRCFDCNQTNVCKYDANKVYLRDRARGNNGWLATYLTSDLSDEGIATAIEHGQYGQCVFACDNDVCDYQSVTMQYASGTTATFVMTAFSKDCFRTTKISGSLGEISANDHEKRITVNIFGGDTQVIDVSTLTNDMSAHGGGDNVLMSEFVSYLADSANTLRSNIVDSVKSHAMAFAAEDSRRNGGQLVEMLDYDKNTNKSKSNSK